MEQIPNIELIPSVSAYQFIDHIEEENFPIRFGNPVRICTGEEEEFLCMTAELYKRREEKEKLNLPNKVKMQVKIKEKQEVREYIISRIPQ